MEISQNSENRRPQLSEDDKCKIVLMSSHGFSNAEIGREFDRTRHCIANVINKWFSQRTIKRKVGSGFNRKTSAEQDQQIRDYAETHKKDTEQQILNALDFNISKTTVVRRLKEVEGLHRRKSVKKPELTEQHIEQRFDYALDHSNWTHECYDIVCMDECSINSLPNGTIWITRKNGERFLPENIDATQSTSRCTISIHAWMSCHGLGTATRIEGNLNAVKYLEILNAEIPKINERFQNRNWYLVNDRSSIHTARITQEFFSQQTQINDMHHPPKSPDLNPIENVFGELKRRLSDRIREENSRIRNTEQLWEYIENAWREIASLMHTDTTVVIRGR
ncbi:hypothetical protein B4U80_08243 [Leptotrombidium deliense]|uniref:Tc1-like transposase DDE domain-containing protein n=1 Tax=Leptotrombidium deliense TaxID=299467 RepID=A0A443RZD9_9ACAR|nr:hypothetical protein B4U80_08243 [Leptotrombidium deliense]